MSTDTLLYAAAIVDVLDTPRSAVRSVTHALSHAWVLGHAGQGTVRLAGGRLSEDGGAEYGRLEVLVDGGWGGVCESVSRTVKTDDAVRPGVDRGANFNTAAAVVACRQLGFAAGFGVQPTVRAFDVVVTKD